MGWFYAKPYVRYNAARHYETTAPGQAMNVINSQDSGDVQYKGLTLEWNGMYYIAGSGKDIWSQFYSQEMSDNVNVKVHLTAFQSVSSWSKAGPMIRNAMDPGSKYVASSLLVHSMFTSRDGTLPADGQALGD